MDSTKLKAFLDDKINITHTIIAVLDGVQNMVSEKEKKKCWLQAFMIAVLDGVQNSVGKGKKRLVTSI